MVLNFSSIVHVWYVSEAGRRRETGGWRKDKGVAEEASERKLGIRNSEFGIGRQRRCDVGEFGIWNWKAKTMRCWGLMVLLIVWSCGGGAGPLIEKKLPEKEIVPGTNDNDFITGDVINDISPIDTHPVSEVDVREVDQSEVETVTMDDICVPDCSDKECGDDGCGGQCGSCLPGHTCTETGVCSCIPVCDGIECGHDGCGGLCGECPDGEVCIDHACNGCSGSVAFADSNLAKAVADITGVPVEDFTGEILEGVVSLEVTGSSISELSGIECLVNLKSLTAADNDVTDLTPLSSLQALKHLAITENTVEDLSPLAGLPQLATIIANANQISSLDPVVNIPKLEVLEVAQNAFQDLNPLDTVYTLNILNAAGNGITDITPVANLLALQQLILHTNDITDLIPIVDNPGISSGDLVDIRYNPIDCAGQKENIDALQGRGVDLKVDCD